jgi:hypothetical protein
LIFPKFLVVKQGVQNLEVIKLDKVVTPRGTL